MEDFTIDFETYSDVDLKKAGAWKYSEHPSTEILMLGYARGQDEPKLWLAGDPPPDELLTAIDKGARVVAHGVEFERSHWENICVKRFGWPEIEPIKWRCTMARAASRALPLGLDELTRALNLVEKKDRRGKQLINLFCKPQKATKKQPARRIRSEDKPEEWEEFKAYCLQDVRAEQEVDRLLGPLLAANQRVFMLNGAMNARGMYIDLDSVDNALAIVAQCETRLTAKLQEITFGEIDTHNQRDKIMALLVREGVELEDMTADTVEELLPSVKRSHGEDSLAYQVLDIRQRLAKASSKKLGALRDATCRDGRVRGLSQYHGAFTGRNAGRLVQPLNLPRPKLQVTSADEDGKVTRNMVPPEQLIEDLRSRDAGYLEMLYGDPMQAVADALRPMFMAAPGKLLCAADLSAIEAVGLAALAGQESKLDVFRRGEDPYCVFASGALGRTVTKKTDPLARQEVGKVGELAFGYGGGVGAWRAFDDSDRFTDDEVKVFQKSWREQHAEIARPPWDPMVRDKVKDVGLWYGLERAYKHAMIHGEASYRDLRYKRRGMYMICYLPSGRPICYYDPKLIERPHRWREDETEVVISYMSVKKGRWQRVETWGGKLAENCLSGNSEVLTPHGWRRVVDLQISDLLWDGEEWVRHEGIIAKGVQLTRPLDGVWMTAEHEVLTAEGWRHASLCEGLHRAAARLPSGSVGRGIDREAAPVAGAVRLRERNPHGRTRVCEGEAEILRVQAGRVDRSFSPDAWDDPPPGVRSLEVNDRSLSAANTPSLAQLRGPRDIGVRRMGGELRSLLGGHVFGVPNRAYFGTERQYGRVSSWQLPVGGPENAGKQQADEYSHLYTLGRDDRGPSGAAFRYWGHDASLSDRQSVGGGRVVPAAERTEAVFDILNCGPRNRFVVRGQDGPFIVHNCTQAACCDILVHGHVRAEPMMPALMTIYDELIVEVDEKEDVERCKRDLIDCMTTELPAWCASWPIKAEAWAERRYRKG